MKTLRFDFVRGAINPESFHEELQSLLGDHYDSMDTGDAGIIIRLTERAEAGDEQAVHDHFKSHDPAAKSQQQNRLEERAAALERLKTVDVAAAKQNPEALAALLEDMQKALGGQA